MKRSIRRGVFETNSSSTHSICIVPAEDFEAWKRGELVFQQDEGELVSVTPNPDAKITVRYRDATGKLSTKEVPDTPENREQYYYDEFTTYEQWQDNCDLEIFVEEKAIKGVRVVAFGKYGYDG